MNNDVQIIDVHMNDVRRKQAVPGWTDTLVYCKSDMQRFQSLANTNQTGDIVSPWGQDKGVGVKSYNSKEVTISW